jgi:hypothetical protein
MAEKESKKTDKSKKVRTAKFMTWAKERSQVPTALGASVAFNIPEGTLMTEDEFVSHLDKYGSQKSFNA